MKFLYRPCETIRITSGYGYRNDPIHIGKRQFHAGIDVSPKDKVKYYQEAIYACADGTVEIASFNSARGNQALINHGDRVKTRSQHLADMLVKVGQTVKAGQIIGHMGTTGDSTGQHLHFEVIVNGKTQNPVDYVMMLPVYVEIKHSDNYYKVQKKYGFDDNTMAYLEKYQYAEDLFSKMLLPKEQQSYQLSTVQYILEYKFGKEVFAKLSE